MCKRRFAVVCRLVRFYVRQAQREIFLWDRHISAFFAVDERDRLAPVSLAGEYPVAQLIIYFRAGDALFFQIGNNFLFGFLHSQAVEDPGIDHDACLAVGEGFLLHIAALDDFDDRQAELFREIPVARIVARNRHDRACAVGYEDVIRDEDRDLLFRQGVGGGDAVEPHAGLVLGDLCALKVGFLRRFLLIGTDFIQIFQAVRPLFNIRMLRRNDHIGRTVKRIRTGGVDRQLVPSARREIDLCAGGTADPVLLLRLDALRIIDQIQIVDEPLGVLRDLEHPLRLDAADNLAAAAFAHAVDNLLVREHAFAGGAPVDGHLFFVGKAVLEQLEENPLCPLVIVGIGGVDLARPVERNAERLDLLLKAGDILLCHLSRVDVVLNGIVLGGQAERVPADGIEHVVALKPALARHDVERRIRARMADMKPLTGGIRELYQRVILRLFARIGRVENAGFLPLILPFFFDLFRFVFHGILSS